MPEGKLTTQERRAQKHGRPRHSQRYQQIQRGVKSADPLPPGDALTMVKEKANAKFDETVEIAVNLGVDPRHGDQMVRGTTNLP